MGQVLVKATEAEAAAAANDSRWMSPLRTKQFLDEKAKGLPKLLVAQQSANSGGLWGVMDGAMIEFLGDVGYLFGGWAGAPTNADWDTGTVTNLVYKTEDFGVTWAKIRDHDLTPDSTHFIPCHFCPHGKHSVSGTEYIYLLGGDPSSEGATPAAYMHSEVRRTTDGINWTKVNSVTPGWDGISLAAFGSLGGNLYLAGGHLTPGGIPDLVVGTAKNEVWRSTDHGATWTSLGNAGWAARQPQDRLALHNGKLWVVGGGKYDNDNNLRVFYNDVWSFDGTTWTEVLADGLAPWPARFYANVFSFGGWLYVSRGTDRAGNRSDTWRSRDGVKWYEVDLGASFIPSHADGLGVHSSGFMQAAGNGRFTNEVNTNSPTYFVSHQEEQLADSIASLAQEVVDTSVVDYAGIIDEGYTEGTNPRVITPGNNAKLSHHRMPHYNGSEEPITVVGGYSTATENFVLVGGGLSAAENAATEIDVYVAATANTLIGTLVEKTRSGGKALTGKLALGQSVVPAAYTIDAIGTLFLLGGDEAAGTGHARTDALAKLMVLAAPLYTGGNVVGLQAYSVSGTTYLDWGGGHGSFRAATLHRFWATTTPTVGFGTEMMHLDATVTADASGMLLLINGTMKRVTVGAADSGGTGFRVLRVPN